MKKLLPASIPFILAFTLIACTHPATATTEPTILPLETSVSATLSPLNFASIQAVDGWTVVTPQVFVSTGSEGAPNLTLIRSGTEAALIDTGYRKPEAEKVKKYIDEQGLALKFVILTHMHADHTGNLDLFQGEDVVVYKPFELEESQILKLDEYSLKVLHTGGHGSAKGHVSVELVEEQLLVAGDILQTNALPALSGSFREMVETLESVKDSHYRAVIPGHGPVIVPDQAISYHLEYFSCIEQAIQSILQNDGEDREVKDIQAESCLPENDYLDPRYIEPLHKNIVTQMMVELSREAAK